MKYLLRNRNFWMLALLDFCLLYLSYYLSYFLRFEGHIPPEHIASFQKSVWLIIILKQCCFLLFRLYKGMWRYTSIPDLLNLLKSTAVSSAVIMLAILIVHQFKGFARSVFIIDAALTLLFVGGVRVLIRIILTRSNSTNGHPLLSFFPGGQSNFKRLLIIGAGDAGEKIFREIRDNPRLEYHIVGFVDDDPKKTGLRIHGTPILGGIDNLSKFAKEYEIDEILIAISSASGREMRRIVESCEATRIKFRTIPGIAELIDGRVSVKTIRDVAYDDLMGRKPVQMEMEKVGEYIQNRPVLVTGAGGSIGAELCRQIARFNPDNLICLDCTENNLYQIELEFAQRYPDVSSFFILGNILNRNLVMNVFRKYRPAVVFHAAAYKHVPMMELNPWEAVRTNVLGTQTLLEVAQNFAAERFVFVSTDKAVRPTNVMGASKRMAELLLQEKARQNNRHHMAVRFGNVIGSSGSVIPLFKRQIEQGGPVTVTHPEVVRYFMTIPEAAQLILQAGAMGEGGEIFILDMGSPVKILDLARDLIRLSGFKPGEDIEIRFIGLRPGEKLYEELITDGEGIVPTHHEKIMVLRGGGCDPNWLSKKIEELRQLAEIQDASGIRGKLKEILPEYQPNGDFQN